MRTTTRTFENDIKLIFSKLKNKEKFSFSKYADGEYAILVNQKITNCDNWTFDPAEHQIYRDELLKSFQFTEKDYYVGISCPCCVPKEHVEWMRLNVGVTEDYLTWANIFVNGNYKFYLNNFIEEYKNHDIVLVANKDASINLLPFYSNISEHIGISNIAWKDDFHLITELPKKDYKNKLFLFCAGPLGNMLAHRMWEKNKNNIYLDVGSTLNSWLVGNNRGYLRGSSTINKICIW